MRYLSRSLPETTLSMIREIRERGGFLSDAEVIKYAVRKLYNEEKE